MTVPAIRNYEQRPPAGGWGLKYTFKGQVFPFGGSWREVTRGIADLLHRNSAFNGMDEIFEYCNSVWCSRDPQRCMSPADRSQAQKAAGRACSTCGSKRIR